MSSIYGALSKMVPIKLSPEEVQHVKPQAKHEVGRNVEVLFVENE